MNIKRILISSLLIASVTSMTSCDISVPDFLAKRGSSAKAAAKQTVYAPELDPDIHELITDQRFKSLENDEPVRFETAVTPEELLLSCAMIPARLSQRCTITASTATELPATVSTPAHIILRLRAKILSLIPLISAVLIQILLR